MLNVNVYRSYGELHKAGLEFVFQKLEVADFGNTHLPQFSPAMSKRHLVEHGLSYAAEYCAQTLFDRRRLSMKYYKLLEQMVHIESEVANDQPDLPQEKITPRRTQVFVLRMISSNGEFGTKNLEAFERQYNELISNTGLKLPPYFFIAAAHLRAQGEFLIARNATAHTIGGLLNECVNVTVANWIPRLPAKVIVAALGSAVQSILRDNIPNDK